MDLKKRLELGQSKLQTGEIVEYVNGRPNRFKLLVEVFLNGSYRITQRAAWPLSICVERWPYLVDPHIKPLLNFLHKPGIHDAVKRNTMRLLQFIDIPKRYHGKVAALCFEYLEDRKVAVAIRVCAMTVLGNIAIHHPEMKKELRLIIGDLLPYGTAALRSRGVKVLKQLAE
jgi:hypothetical protein